MADILYKHGLDLDAMFQFPKYVEQSMTETFERFVNQIATTIVIFHPTFWQ